MVNLFHVGKSNVYLDVGNNMSDCSCMFAFAFDVLCEAANVSVSEEEAANASDHLAYTAPVRACAYCDLVPALVGGRVQITQAHFTSVHTIIMLPIPLPGGEGGREGGRERERIVMNVHGVVAKANIMQVMGGVCL